MQIEPEDLKLCKVYVSRETLLRLDSYVQSLLRWQKTINLISPSTVDHVWERHILDSAQLVPIFPEARVWLDIGSGAGLPALVVAILRQEAQPDFSISMIEANLKKCAFLREAIRISKANATVLSGRIEHIVNKPLAPTPDVVTARALAPLPDLLEMCRPLLERGTKAVFMKGAGTELELTEARKHWNIDAELIQSVTESESRLVLIHSAKKRLA